MILGGSTGVYTTESLLPSLYALYNVNCFLELDPATTPLVIS